MSLVASAFTMGVDSATDGTTYSYTASGLPPGGKVLLIFVWGSTAVPLSGRYVTGVTVEGGETSAQTISAVPSSAMDIDPFGVYRVDGLTGTSTTIRATFNDTMTGCNIGHVVLTGSGHEYHSRHDAVPTATVTGTTATSTPGIVIPSGGLGFGVLMGRNATLPTAWTADAGTPDEIADAEGASGLRCSVCTSTNTAATAFTATTGGIAGKRLIAFSFAAAPAMVTGLSTSSHASEATFAAVTGSVSSDYPITNLSDLVAISKPTRITPSGDAIAFTAVLSANRTLQMAALVNHTLPFGATVRTRFYSDAGMTTLVTGGDLGPTAIPNPRTGYKQTFPAVMDAAQTVRAIRWDIASAGASAIDFGGAEIAKWWELPKITATADIGFSDPGQDVQLLGGGSVGSEGYTPRTYAGQVSHMALSISESTGLDFQKLKGLARPFVFVEHYDDPATWPRTCFLARNLDLPPFVARLYDRDTFQFRLKEHVR